VILNDEFTNEKMKTTIIIPEQQKKGTNS